MGLKLYTHQQNGVTLLSEHDGFGLFWDMGSGKTLTMLTHVSNLILSGEVEHCLWLAPKSALGAVERDLDTMQKNGLAYRVDALKKALMLLNYEKLSRKTSKWRKVVENIEWDCVVLDEAHCIARPQANRTKYLIGTTKKKGLLTDVKYRYVMTGTPVTNARMEDFWSFLYLMNKGDFIPYNIFMSLYTYRRNIPGTYAKVVTGYKNIDTLLEIVAKYSQSLTKEECLDLPEMMPDNVIKIPWSKSAKKIYDTAIQENVIECAEEVFDNPLVRTLRLRQIAAGHVNTDDGIEVLDNEKVSYTMELVENNPHKTVIFYEFKSSFEVLTKALESAKIPYMFLNGEQSNKNIWRDFQEASETECRVFLTQYRSGNAGIDLYTSSDTIFFEPCVSSTVLNQARSRTHRNGVSRACTFTFLITSDSIEEDIYNNLQGYEDFNDKMWLELKRKELTGM